MFVYTPKPEYVAVVSNDGYAPSNYARIKTFIISKFGARYTTALHTVVCEQYPNVRFVSHLKVPMIPVSGHLFPESLFDITEGKF